VIKYYKYRKRAKRFLALTGYKVEEFDALLTEFANSFKKRMEKYTLDGKERQKRRFVDYSNSPLPSIGEKLFFILSYLKSYPLQEVQAALFGLSQPKANQWIHCLTPVLQEALATLGEVPARAMADLAVQVKDQNLFFHDGTERPIPRPLDPEMQRLFYSGKAKMHTVKNNVLIDDSCRILFLTATVEGKRHDKKLADETGYVLPNDSRLLQDTGFQGFTLDNIAIWQPKKKPRGQSLSDLDKSRNQWLASLRIRVEHAIGGVQRLRIVKDKNRNWKENFRDSIMEICCALHNFRLKFRPWRYLPTQLHLFVEI
jgi:hypothetical protein